MEKTIIINKNLKGGFEMFLIFILEKNNRLEITRPSNEFYIKNCIIFKPICYLYMPNGQFIYFFERPCSS